jgi:hypothetical protein
MTKRPYIPQQDVSYMAGYGVAIKNSFLNLVPPRGTDWRFKSPPHPIHKRWQPFMRGQEILKRHVGHKLTDGLVMSFYNNNDLVNQINNSFLKFDSEWIRIVCTDEQTNIYNEVDDIYNFNLKTDDGFEFRVLPIGQLFPEFNMYFDKKLLGFKELVSNKWQDMSFGINLYFEDNLNFIIRNHDYPVDQNEYLFKDVKFTDLIEV